MSESKQKRSRGKPPLSASDRTVRVNVTMTESQRDKFHALGGSEWLREMVEKWWREQGNGKN